MSFLKACVVAALIGLAGFPVWGQTFESLYSFPEDGSYGVEPYATLTVGPSGPGGEQRLYGTASRGGAKDAGTAFSVSLSGQVSFLAAFDPESTGRYPYARLLNIGDGYLYGVTEKSSEILTDWAGTVYRLDPAGSISQVFQIPSDDPEQLTPTPTHPRALAYGEANTLHVLCADYPGLWRVPLNGTAPEVVYSFAADSIDGYTGWSLIRGTDGYFYGTTIGSADAGDYPMGRGTIFRIAPDGSGMTSLYECQFTSGTRPHGALLEGPDGNFYGVMRAGGPEKEKGGCVFRLTPSGVYTILYAFGTQTNDLKAPYGDLMLGTDGQLYGTARDAGPQGYGGVFQIKTNGSGYKILHAFNRANGAYPEGGLVQAADGNLYGTTTEGGSGNKGTVFRIKLKLAPLPENRRPVAVNDIAVTTGGAVEIDVRANDYDPDGDRLTVAIKTGPTAGTAEVRPGGTILYTPNGPGVEDQFTYTITDGRGGEAFATVRITSTEPGPLLEPRTYQGLLMLDPELRGDSDVPRGQISVKLGAGGRFTGVLLTQRKRVVLRGTFSDVGNAVVFLKLPNKRPAALFLSLEAGVPNVLRGVLFGPELWAGGALPAQASGSAAKESFTAMLIPNTAGLPDGYGFAVMKVSPSGAVSMAGKLGDGSKLSWSSTLVLAPGNATILPVFSEPLAAGFCGGWLEKRETSGAQGFMGSLRWKRPAASKQTKPYPLEFNGKTNLIAVPFTPPAASSPAVELEDGAVEIGGGKLLEPVEGEFTLNGKKVVTRGNLRALSFNRSSGLFSGKMLAGKKLVGFQGVVLQVLNGGVGQFSINGETGAVELDALRK